MPPVSDGTGYVPLAAVERSGFDEGVHFGRLVAWTPTARGSSSYGDVDAPIHPRSANKLMQAAGMRSLGLRLEGEQLALSAASHWGEPRHVEAVRAILASAGLDESALQTTPDLPEDADARRAVVRGDGVARPIYHGCSGKHAAMLATCVMRGWDPATYLEPDHPLQAGLAAISRRHRRRVAHTAVDGCGAPAWAIPLTALAGAYRTAVIERRSVTTCPMTTRRRSAARGRGRHACAPGDGVR